MIAAQIAWAGNLSSVHDAAPHKSISPACLAGSSGRNRRLHVSASKHMCRPRISPMDEKSTPVCLRRVPSCPSSCPRRPTCNNPWLISPMYPCSLPRTRVVPTHLVVFKYPTRSRALLRKLQRYRQRPSRAEFWSPSAATNPELVETSGCGYRPPPAPPTCAQRGQSAKVIREWCSPRQASALRMCRALYGHSWLDEGRPWLLHTKRSGPLPMMPTILQDR